MPIKNFGQITRGYLGQPFDECSCLRLLYNVYKEAGCNLPSEYKGYTLDTYMTYWEEKPKEAIQDMIELFKTIGEETDPMFLKKGDALIVKCRKSQFPAIYIGNNNIIAVTKEKGVVVTALGSHFQLILARRFI